MSDTDKLRSAKIAFDKAQKTYQELEKEHRGNIIARAFDANFCDFLPARSIPAADEKYYQSRREELELLQEDLRADDFEQMRRSMWLMVEYSEPKNYRGTISYDERKKFAGNVRCLQTDANQICHIFEFALSSDSEGLHVHSRVLTEKPEAEHLTNTRTMRTICEETVRTLPDAVHLLANHLALTYKMAKIELKVSELSQHVRDQAEPALTTV